LSCYVLLLFRFNQRERLGWTEKVVRAMRTFCVDLIGTEGEHLSARVAEFAFTADLVHLIKFVFFRCTKFVQLLQLATQLLDMTNDMCFLKVSGSPSFGLI
jgi:hypothetical protein